MTDHTLRAFLEKAVYAELAPFVPLPAAEVKSFADFVMERFGNPFIRHNLLAIAMNSVSKFKVRVLPTILETQAKTNIVPKCLCFSLAALMAFYSGKWAGGKLTGTRGADIYEIFDDAPVLDFFASNHPSTPIVFVEAFLSRADFWDSDLSLIPGFAETVALSLQDIRDFGIRSAVERVIL
jgi:tagaturonate reductase